MTLAPMSPSSLASSRSRAVMMRPILFCRTVSAAARKARFFSAVIICTICLRLARRPAKAKVSASGRGLIAGFTFALSNVLVKAARQVSPEAKSLAGCIGVLVVAMPVVLLIAPGTAAWSTLSVTHYLLLAVVGVTLIATSVALQFGLTHVTANYAAVIMLFELIVAAIAAHYLAGEVAHAQDWLGGAMIVAAGLYATWAESRIARN